MDEWIVLTEHNWAFWVAGMFALFEFFRWAYSGVEWLFKTFGIETRKMREVREYRERLASVESSIAEIKQTSKQNVEMFLTHEKQIVDRFVVIRDEIVDELNKLHGKIDEQTQEIAKNRKENDETDRAMLRDRLNSSMRYFSRNVDEHGKVHISLAEYEALDGLFQKYFAKKGNGAFEKMYTEEFKKFVIDR